MPGPTVALTSLRTERAMSHWRRMVPLLVHLWKSLEAYLLASVGVRSEERKNVPTNVNRCKVWAGYKGQERPKWLDLSSPKNLWQHVKIQYIHLHPLTTPRLVYLFTTAWIKQDNPTSRIFEASPQVSAFAEKIELFTLGLYNLQHLQVLQIVARAVCDNVTSHLLRWHMMVWSLQTIRYWITYCTVY